MFNTSETENLFNAADRNDINEVKFFIEEKGAPAAIINDLGETLAHIAVKNGNLQLVKYIVEKEPSAFKNSDEYLYSLLQLAVQKNAVDIIKYLVEELEADISKGNCPDYRTTALHTAIKFGHSNLLKYFINERKANVDITDWQYKPLVFFAAKYEHRDILKYLIEEKKANLTMVDRYQENILYIAVRKDDIDLMKYLLDERQVKLDINWRNYGGETLVHKAVVWNRINIIKYLVGDKHADVNVPDKWHFMTPLHYAASRNNFEIFKFLVKHGADTQFQDDTGHIPIQKATDKRLIEYVQNVSIRNRRSIKLPYLTSYPNPIPYERQKISGEVMRLLADYSGDGILTSLGDSYSRCISNCLLIIEMIMRSRKILKSQAQPFYLTPRAILQNRMDMDALNAISDVPTFLQS